METTINTTQKYTHIRQKRDKTKKVGTNNKTEALKQYKCERNRNRARGKQNDKEIMHHHIDTYCMQRMEFLVQYVARRVDLWQASG